MNSEARSQKSVCLGKGEAKTISLNINNYICLISKLVRQQG